MHRSLFGYTDERSGYDGSIRVFAEPSRRNGSIKGFYCLANTTIRTMKGPALFKIFLFYLMLLNIGDIGVKALWSNQSCFVLIFSFHWPI
ncbi:hypothetical protein EUGRSUZ_I01848 [Eucalyptus grandis]|uniref:Uncharacterized protein n=2 Tax=Eucalyptus grandis TaxID=71139 RepID=A0A059ARP4_EUCGR|nr:hypothetical protein EUGRSUZ_I01848 [Eucalyptus grandis]